MIKSFGVPRIEYVTTSRGPEPAQVERARAVAARCGVAFRERSRARPSRDGRVYVVERGRERLRRGAEALGVHVGMRAARRARGEAHPLLRALGLARRVVDGTAGLGQDAMHLADAGREVVAIEASPVVYSLLEAALPRLAPDVALRFGGAEAELAELEADAVYLDPMFRRAAKGPPGYGLFREVAAREPMTPALLRAAARAAPRVVVKLPRGEEAPEGLAWTGRVEGKAVAYAVFERG